MRQEESTMMVHGMMISYREPTLLVHGMVTVHMYRMPTLLIHVMITLFRRPTLLSLDR